MKYVPLDFPSHVKTDVRIFEPLKQCCGVMGACMGHKDGETHFEEVEWRVNARNNRQAGKGSGMLSRRPSESEMGRIKAGIAIRRREALTV